MVTKINFVLALILNLSFLVTAQSHQCPEIYLRFSKEHSFCQTRNSSCEIVEENVTPEDKAHILRKYNQLRNKVATGQQTGLPEASNMMQMVWDQELAIFAQKRAEQCVYEHDCFKCRESMNFPVGQAIGNRRMICGSDGCPKHNETEWDQVIQDFYDEVKDFDVSRLNKFELATGNQYEHFTQMVWAKTWRIGCGFATFKIQGGYEQLYVCNYGPVGNMKDKPLYESGKACSGCPNNTCCGTDCEEAEFPGLCKMLREDEEPIQASPEKDYLFHCDFRSQVPDCKVSQFGSKGTIIDTLDGPFAEVVARGGTSNILVFDKQITPQTSFCLRFLYKSGPLHAGDNPAHTIDLIFDVKDAKIPDMQLTPNPEGDFFFTENLNLNWNLTTRFGINFTIPTGAPPQYLDIRDIAAMEGPCKAED